MVSQSRAYLQACNQIFEEGFLSHRGIYDMNSPVLQSINEGYQFFVNWYNALDGKYPLCNGRISTLTLVNSWLKNPEQVTHLKYNF